MAEIFYEKDANLDLLTGKTVAIFGYGSQGHAHALNLRDSGVPVVVALRPESSSKAKAEAEGLKVLPFADAAKEANVVSMLLPDTEQARIYSEDIAPNLNDGDALFFAHGFNIRFNCITPDAGLDVAMVAPKGPGHLVRRTFVEGGGVPCLVAAEQDATGSAMDLALAYGLALGAGKAGMIKTTFTEECETDLFGEQTILCGGLTNLALAAFETLTEAGYQPEVAYFECLHELKLIVDLIYEQGMAGMNYSISDTAEYGSLSRGPRIIDGDVKKKLKGILDDIQSGEFAKDWIGESESGRGNFKEMQEKSRSHPIEKVGAELREMMPWISEGKQDIREASGG